MARMRRNVARRAVGTAGRGPSVWQPMAALRSISSPARQLIAGALVLAAALVVEIAVLSSAASAPPRHLMESMFQDDDHLVYASTAIATATLDRLERLGVDTIRVTVLWKAIAPRSTSPTAPPGFRATDPAAYPAAAWSPYDRLVALAQARRI